MSKRKKPTAPTTADDDAAATRVVPPQPGTQRGARPAAADRPPSARHAATQAGASTGASTGAVASVTPALRLLVVDLHLLWTVVALALIAGFVWLIRGALPPLLFVCVLAFLGAPVVDRLARSIPRGVAAAVFVLSAALAVIALLSLVVPALIGDLVTLFQKLPALLKEAATWAERTFSIAIPTRIEDLSSEASKELLDQLLPFAKGGGAIVGTGALGVLAGAIGAAALLAQAFVVPVLAFFLLSELPRVGQLVQSLTPNAVRGVLSYYGPRVNETLAGLVRGQLLVASMMAVLYVLGLSISGVPLALAIGAIAGAAYLVPYASGVVCFILAAAFSLLELQGHAVRPIVGTVITIVVVQLIEGYLLTPRIVGEKAGLSPLAALLAVFLGASAAGLIGAVFALPTGAVVALMLREEARRRGGLLVHPEGST